VSQPVDVQAIESAYEEQLKAMFQVLFENSLSEGLNEAVARFSKGLSKLREARDRAKQIVNS
jgi:hypothetical protein